MNIVEKIAFRAVEVEVELDSNIAFVDANKLDKALKNKASRLKTCATFAKASSQALELIAQNSSESMIDELMNYSNYKTANRVLQLAQYLNNENIDNRTAQNIKLLQNSLKALAKSFDAFEYASIEARCSITASMLKNMLKSAQLLKVIERVDNQDIKAVIRADTKYRLINQE